MAFLEQFIHLFEHFFLYFRERFIQDIVVGDKQFAQLSNLFILFDQFISHFLLYLEAYLLLNGPFKPLTNDLGG